MISLDNQNLKVNSKDELYQIIANKLYEKKYIYSKNNFLKKIYERESIGDIYIGNGILLPHIKDKTVRKNKICVYLLENILGEIKLVVCILAKKNLGMIDYKKIVRFIREIDDEKMIKKLIKGEIWKLEK